MGTFKFEQSVNGIVAYVHELYHLDGYSLSDVHLEIQDTKKEVTLFPQKTFMLGSNNQLRNTLIEVVNILFADLPKIKEGMHDYILKSKGEVAVFFLKWPNQSQF